LWRAPSKRVAKTGGCRRVAATQRGRKLGLVAGRTSNFEVERIVAPDSDAGLRVDLLVCLPRSQRVSHVAQSLQATAAWLAPQMTVGLSVVRTDEVWEFDADSPGFDFRLAALRGRVPEILIAETTTSAGSVAIRIIPSGHRHLTALALQPPLDGLLFELTSRDRSIAQHAHMAAALAAHAIAWHCAPRDAIGACMLPLVARIVAVVEASAAATGSTPALETERGALASWGAAWLALATDDRARLQAASDRLGALAGDPGRLCTPTERARIDLQRSLVTSALGRLAPSESERWQHLDTALTAALDARDALAFAGIAPDAPLSTAAGAIAGSTAGALAIEAADVELQRAAERLLAEAEEASLTATDRAAIAHERAHLTAFAVPTNARRDENGSAS
jgi:hypothetical protein